MVTREHYYRGQSLPRVEDLFTVPECLALDIETDPTLNQELVVLSLSDGERAYLIDLRTYEPHVLRDWLTNEVYQYLVVGHNLIFDLMHLHDRLGCGYPERRYDTMLAEQVLTAGLTQFDYVGLDDVLERYCRVYLDKALQTSFRVDEELTEDQIEYALGDVLKLPRVREVQMKRIKAHELETIFTLEMLAMEVFSEMIRVGVWIDMVRMGPLLEENRITRDRLKRELQLKLTPIVMNERMEKRKAQEDERAKWQEAFDEETARQEEYWRQRVLHDEDWKLLVGYPPGWEEGDFDETIDKKDGKHKGMKRYVRRKMSTKGWRAENPIPKLEPINSDLINLNSSQQVLYVFNQLGLYPEDLDGKSTTGKKTLEAMLADATPEQRVILRTYLDYRKAEKIETSFSTRLLDKRDAAGRVHGSFRPIGTATGRPSCSSPNMNQMPNEPSFRSCFRAVDGDVFVVADYQQMELRLIAELSGDESMIRSFTEGKDLHTYTAALMFGVSEEQVTSAQRKTAKIINFGILYGMGPRKLRGTLAAEGIHMTMDEARDAVNRWKAAYPQASAQINEWGRLALQQGWTATPFGRKRFFDLDFTDEDGEYDQSRKFAVMRAAANHPIQGTNADITKLAMVGIYRLLAGRGEIILQVYDEIVVQCRQEHAEDVRDLVVDMMVRAAQKVLKQVPAGVDAVISRSWNEGDAVAEV